MTKVVIGGLLILLAINCGRTNDSKQPGRIQPVTQAGIPQEISRNVVVPLQEIDLSKIGHIAPKGRVQDKDYNDLPIVDQLIANGRESIPYLISKIEDDTKINEHVMDYWSEMRVGDVAQIILKDFFTDYSWTKTTIPGVAWGTFLGCKGVDYFTREQCLRNYIKRFGRKGLKAKWQHVWDKNKEKIYWDEADRSFRLKTPTAETRP